MMSELLLHLRNITKAFPGVLALDEVSFDLQAGEIHAICGENGAGKSTLMNIISGNHQPDAGQITLSGQDVIIENQLKSQSLGIGIVHQEKSLVGNMSVADNIFAGTQPVSRWGIINRKKMIRDAGDLLHRLGLPEIDPSMPLSQLLPGKQQMVEIAKALSQEPQILILDEPTAAISESDAEILFRIVRRLAGEGKAIIYISHRMSEIFDISDRVTVLKDGQYQGTRQTQETDINEIIRMMVGRDLRHLEYQNHSNTDIVMEVSALTGDRFHDISFDLHEGEILGLSGLVGAGRSELARAIFGIDAKMNGNIKIKGKPVVIRHPQDAMGLHLAYLPEHRKEQGLFLEMSVRDNLAATNLRGLARHSLLSQKDLDAVASHYIDRLGIRTPSAAQKVINLSGGNQQKVVLAKWLLVDPDILIIDEPTQGIDVGAKSEIYRLLNDLTAKGVSVLMISSELPELIGICDRIMIMCHGTMTGILSREDFSEEEIMHYSSGTKNMFKQTG